MKNQNFTKIHYTDNYLCFQEEKINKLGKTDLLELLKNRDSWLYVLIKEDVCNIFMKTKGYIDSYINFDDLYAFSVETTIMQLNKRYFFDIFQDKNIKIIKKIKSRLVNNMKNFFSNKRKYSYFNVKDFIHKTEAFYDYSEEIIIDLDLCKIDENRIKEGLRNLLFDDTFDFEDFEYICKKFNFEPIDILIHRPYIIPKMIKIATSSRNYFQLALIFDSIEEVA